MDNTETLATLNITHTHTHKTEEIYRSINTLHSYGTVNFKYKTIQIRTKVRILLQRILA
jgi:hypothetical protein